MGSGFIQTVQKEKYTIKTRYDQTFTLIRIFPPNTVRANTRSGTNLRRQAEHKKMRKRNKF